MKLRPTHLRAAMNEDSVPRHLHVIEVHQRVVLVVACSERVVELGNRVLLEGLAREHQHVLLGPGPERLW